MDGVPNPFGDIAFDEHPCSRPALATQFGVISPCNRYKSVRKDLVSNMEILQVVSPLLGVLVGGMLTGVTAYLKDRKERKRVIALALSDLLEVRHRMVAFEVFLKKISTVAKLSTEHMAQIREMLVSVAPQDPKLDDRYDAAISLLAGIDPVLAFDMRSRNALPKMLDSFRALAAAHNVAPSDFAHMEAFLTKETTPKLNSAVEKLARCHSMSTARKVKDLIKKSETMPREGEEFFERFSQAVAISA